MLGTNRRQFRERKPQRADWAEIEQFRWRRTGRGEGHALERPHCGPRLRVPFCLPPVLRPRAIPLTIASAVLDPDGPAASSCSDKMASDVAYCQPSQLI